MKRGDVWKVRIIVAVESSTDLRGDLSGGHFPMWLDQKFYGLLGVFRKLEPNVAKNRRVLEQSSIMRRPEQRKVDEVVWNGDGHGVRSGGGGARVARGYSWLRGFIGRGG